MILMYANVECYHAVSFTIALHTYFTVLAGLIKVDSSSLEIWCAILPTFTRWTILFSSNPRSFLSLKFHSTHRNTNGSTILQCSNPLLLSRLLFYPRAIKAKCTESVMLDEIFWVDNRFGKKQPGALVGCG